MGFSEMDEAKTKRIDTMCVSGVLLTGKLRVRGIWPGMRGSQKEYIKEQDKRGTGFPIQRIGDGAGSLGPMMPARGMKG